jgi:hypothetical protein
MVHRKQPEPELQTTKEDKRLKTPRRNENGKHRKTQIAQGLFLRLWDLQTTAADTLKTDYLD